MCFSRFCYLESPLGSSCDLPKNRLETSPARVLKLVFVTPSVLSFEARCIHKMLVFVAISQLKVREPPRTTCKFSTSSLRPRSSHIRCQSRYAFVFTSDLIWRGSPICLVVGKSSSHIDIGSGLMSTLCDLIFLHARRQKLIGDEEVCVQVGHH